MIDRLKVEEALSEVNDPELHRPLTQLNMIRDIAVDGNDVTVTIALTTAGCPLKDTIRLSVEERLKQLPGIGRVDVRLGEMSQDEREELLGRKLKASIFEEDSKTRVLAIASGKGGVGKSSVTVNLAVALKRMGFDVGVIDCDVYGFSVPRMTGVEGQKPTVIDKRIIPVPAHGLKVISMGFFVDDQKPVMWRGPMLGKMLRQFLTSVVWGDLDFLLMDLPPGTGDMAIDVAQLVPKAKLMVVTTPEVVAAGVANRAARMAETTKQSILGVVENMSGFICPCCGERTDIFGQGGGEEVARRLEVPLLAQIPLTMEARTYGDRGVPLASSDEAEAAGVYRELASEVARLSGAHAVS